MAQANLQRYFESPRPVPQTTATSQEIRDRGSIFIANIYPTTSPAHARKLIDYVKHVLHGQRKASHEIAAWRCMVVKHGKSGLDGPDDFELVVGSTNDGEQWAGEKVLKVMQRYAVIDAVVIVSRWFGGELLGPSRFTHIETCASDVCQEYKRMEELKGCLTTLHRLDAVLDGLRDEYNNQAPVSHTGSRTTIKSRASRDYVNIDITKARRLIKAREHSIRSVQSLLKKRPELHIDGGQDG